VIQIPLQNHQNTNYIGEIQIGSPPQKIRALFDTGSANSWVLGQECRTAQTLREKHFYFKSNRSSSWSDTGEQATIYFGSGELKGEFGKDSFWLPQKHGEMEVEQQTFGLVSKQSTFDETFDAIIGLAYP